MPHVPIGGIPMMPHGNHVTYVFYLVYFYLCIYLPRGVSRLLCMRRKKVQDVEVQEDEEQDGGGGGVSP